MENKKSANQYHLDRMRKVRDSKAMRPSNPSPGRKPKGDK